MKPGDLSEFTKESSAGKNMANAFKTIGTLALLGAGSAVTPAAAGAVYGVGASKKGKRLRGAVAGGAGATVGGGIGMLPGLALLNVGANKGKAGMAALGALLGMAGGVWGGLGGAELGVRAVGARQSTKGYREGLKINPTLKELDKAFKAYEKDTGNDKNEMSHDDINRYVVRGRK